MRSAITLSAMSCSLKSRAPRGGPSAVAPVRDGDAVISHLEDAAHVPGGHAAALYVPATEADVAEVIRSCKAVLPIGAQSSLTGGATPMGEALVSMRRFDRILEVSPGSARVQAGVTLADLDATLAASGAYYPPAPTFLGAFLGGTVATNAAGAATFKYGTTRQWIRAITVVLPSGDVLDIERGVTTAHADGYFDLQLAQRTLRVPVPGYHMPHVPKLSAGYFSAAGMDLIDLFIGSEGTLGIVTEVTIDTIPRPAFCLALTTLDNRSAALSLVGQLRESARQTWHDRDPAGLDVSAIEHMDRRCLELLREDGVDRKNDVSLPADTEIALLVTIELAPGTTAEQVYEQIGRAGDTDAPDSPMGRFCALLARHRALDRTTIAAPGDRARASQLLNAREAVPAAVNQRVGRAQQRVDPRIQKTAADMIVPFERFEQLLDFYSVEFSRRNLDAAIWGHISDGNVHPNVIPRSYADVEAGRAAILAFGDEVVRLGGAPLAEHGVGRNAVKQRLLRMLYGAAGIEEMRRTKAALDPEWKLSPGVIFPRT